ncbi:28626_t:CDS:10 [Dentiscutata erythropus]|uniref:28626_t:CDS:1 n=1 Tax=Dentiscutata erythropus TaxID=1348616 RepID=A0A9N8V8K4_9GLOM|nr:28626_t:CDS:10 [Dentiscutata erythropus]
MEKVQENDKSRRLIIISFWVIILIGLPLWWKTTEVYRAQLPFAEIEEWSKWEAFDLDFPTTFILHIADVKSDVNDYKIFSNMIENSIMSKYNLINSTHNDTGYPKPIRFPVKIEVVKWNDWMNAVKEGFNSDLLNFLVNKNGQYGFYILPGNNSKTRVLVGNQRQAIVEIGHWDIGKHFILLDILFLPEQAAIKKFIRGPSAEAKVDVDSMRTMKYSPMYQVTFSLMNGDPSTLLVDWDIKQAVVKYLRPFVDKISMISNLTVESQIQHYARLTFEPQKNLHNDENYFYLTPDLLPHFINAAEWNLASAVSSYPTLNFILYVPSKDQSPLYIKDSKGNIIENNAFLIPRWGGVIINNPDRSVGTHMFTFDELKSVMSIFIMQLRGLLGVQDFWMEARSALDSSISVDFMSPPNTAITMWELDSLIRRRIAENIVSTISTLKSLSQLVAEIPNMVVLDHIQTEVLLALDSLKKSCISLHTGQYEIALQHAKEAIERAETAFFDPTMVSMLYFPDEHKYAIYMPLFFRMVAGLLGSGLVITDDNQKLLSAIWPGRVLQLFIIPETPLQHFAAFTAFTAFTTFKMARRDIDRSFSIPDSSSQPPSQLLQEIVSQVEALQNETNNRKDQIIESLRQRVSKLEAENARLKTINRLLLYKNDGLFIWFHNSEKPQSPPSDCKRRLMNDNQFYKNRSLTVIRKNHN